MKNGIRVLTICVCLLFIFSSASAAKQLSVKKVVMNADIKTGDNINIALVFENPFNKSIPVTIQDNNVLGNNGLEIQCYEYTLRENPASTISYDPIQAFSAGNFSLPPATVTYTNPDTDVQETIKSEPLTVNIKQGTSSNQQQGITTVYNCRGVSMQSTSYSSSGSTSISISGGQTTPQINNPNQQNAPTPDNIRQENQDMQNLKQEMENQQRNYQNMQNELGNLIENSSEFTHMKNELEKEGYNLTSKDIRPSTNTSGGFNYSFNKINETASISGNMDNGSMATINKQSSEDIKRLQQIIESNTTFREMQGSLINKGYNLSDKNINLKSNISSFDYRFNDSQGRNASISGNVTNAGEIKDIALKEPEPLFPYWFLAIILVSLLGIYLYTKFWNSEKHVEPESVTTQLDPKGNALLMLEKAVDMFKNGMEREAYVEASHAVRCYFKTISGINELTSDEIIKSIQGLKNERYVQNVRECFMLCDLVKFAKYEPNAKDFNQVIEFARRIIV